MEPRFTNPAAAEAGGYVLVVAGLLVAVGLIFHPAPTGGFEEDAALLAATPLWEPIHVAIAAGFVLCVLGGLLVLIGGGAPSHVWIGAFCWGALTVGMIYFTGVALINGWVMHALVDAGAGDGVVYDAMNDLLVGFGWLGNPLFLVGLTGIAVLEWRRCVVGISPWLAAFGVAVSVLSWGRGIGSALGVEFLEILLVANVPAFLWLGYYGLRIARLARIATSEV